MPSLLHYEIITDPTSLQASLPGEPSVGTVYILVSNNHQSPVEWDHIDVEFPIVPGATELTSKPAAVTTSIDRTRLSPRDDDLEFKWDSKKQWFRAQVDRTQNPNGATTRLYPQQGLILTLGDIPVSEDAGLVVLEIHEMAGGGDGPVPLRTQPFTTALGLTKQTPRVPRNFRAEKSLVKGEANETLALLWDGPTGLDYAILDQRGAEVYSESPNQGLPSFHKEFAWRPSFAPKRGTTYTLVAKAPGVADQRGYFLTTTVHAEIPEFESGTRTPWIEGLGDNKGRAFFTPEGVDIQEKNHPALGRLRAQKADVDSVITRLVQGRTDEAGWITFPDRGLNVYHGPTNTPAVITAARADVEGVNTDWAGRRDAGQGWVEFSQSGATVHKDGGQDLGTLTADKADVKGLNTKWVGDRDGGKGWLQFPQDGIDIRKDGGEGWGNVHAGKADVTGINTEWVQGRGTGDGWIDFPQNGVRVHRDGVQNLGTATADMAVLGSGVDTPWVGDRDAGKGWIEFPQDGVDVRKAADDNWGTIAAGLASVNDLRTGGARVKGLLTVLGGMNLSHQGKMNRERGSLFSTRPDAIEFTGANEFKQGVRFEKGILVLNGKYSVSMTKESGDMLVSGAGLQVQGGTISVSSGGTPPQVRVL